MSQLFPTKPKHARPTTKADETPEFKEFWEKIWVGRVRSEYDGRALARDEFFHHVWWRDADPQDIVDAARWYERNAKSMECRMLVRTWLDRGLYEDLAEKERAYQAHQAAKASVNVVQMARPTGQTAFLRKWNAEKQEA